MRKIEVSLQERFTLKIFDYRKQVHVLVKIKAF